MFYCVTLKREVGKKNRFQTVGCDFARTKETYQSIYFPRVLCMSLYLARFLLKVAVAVGGVVTGPVTEHQLKIGTRCRECNFRMALPTTIMKSHLSLLRWPVSKTCVSYLKNEKRRRELVGNQRHKRAILRFLDCDMTRARLLLATGERGKKIEIKRPRYRSNALKYTMRIRI